MIQIIKFECKKMFRSKINLIAMASGLFLLVFCVSVWVSQSFYFDGETGEVVYGVDTIKINQQKNKELADVLTEEFLTKEVEEIQRRAEATGAESSEDYWKLIGERRNLASLIASNYGDVQSGWADKGWKILGEIPTEGGIHFYEQRLNKIKECLDMNYSYGDYTSEEKEFWMSKAKKVTTPFLWEDRFAMDNILELIGTGLYLIIVIVICIAPVFSSEYETKADSLLLTTKYGKTKLIWAKIVTSVAFALLYFCLCIGAGTAIIIIFCGLLGWNLPIQLWNTMIPYNLTVGETAVLSLAVMLFGTAAITLFTLLMSARVKSSFIVLIVDFLLLLGPAFLTFSRTSALWNHILYLFPSYALYVREILGIYNSIQIGNTVISYLGMVVIVYGTVGVISLLGIKKGFAGHQVG